MATFSFDSASSPFFAAVAFHLYDLKGTGKVTKEEMLDVLRYSALLSTTSPSTVVADLVGWSLP